MGLGRGLKASPLFSLNHIADGGKVKNDNIMEDTNQ
jgi:hypothetical protein